jgi:hypothetical protein
MNISEAIAAMRTGKRVRHVHWGPFDPSFLVFVPGRLVVASFPPMVDALGQDTEFLSIDHVDAVWATVQGDKIVGATVRVGYQFRQDEILTDAWETV